MEETVSFFKVPTELPSHTMSIHDMYRPCCVGIFTKQQADEYLDYLVRYFEKLGVESPEETHRSNIAFYASYWDADTRKRVFELFETEHPVYGKEPPKPCESMAIGSGPKP
jgi:hypothetical protein